MPDNIEMPDIIGHLLPDINRYYRASLIIVNSNLDIGRYLNGQISADNIDGPIYRLVSTTRQGFSGSDRWQRVGDLTDSEFESYTFRNRSKRLLTCAIWPCFNYLTAINFCTIFWSFLMLFKHLFLIEVYLDMKRTKKKKKRYQNQIQKIEIILKRKN